MNANIQIKDLNDQDLDIELNTLTVLRNTLQMFIPQDEATVNLRQWASARLIEVTRERNSRWSLIEVTEVDHGR